MRSAPQCRPPFGKKNTCLRAEDEIDTKRKLCAIFASKNCALRHITGRYCAISASWVCVRLCGSFFRSAAAPPRPPKARLAPLPPHALSRPSSLDSHLLSRCRSVALWCGGSLSVGLSARLRGSPLSRVSVKLPVSVFYLVEKLRLESSPLPLVSVGLFGRSG